MGNSKVLCILKISMLILSTEVFGKPSFQESGQNVISTVSPAAGHSSNSSVVVREERAPATPSSDIQPACGYSRVSICSSDVCSEQYIQHCDGQSERSETTSQTSGNPQNLIIRLPSIQLPLPIIARSGSNGDGNSQNPVQPSDDSCARVDISLCDPEGNQCEKQNPVTVCKSEQISAVEPEPIIIICDGKCKQRSVDGRCLLDRKCCAREFPEGRQFLRCLLEE